MFSISFCSNIYMAKKETNCSFCGRPRAEGGMLSAGVSGHICESCITQGYTIVQEEMGAGNKAATKTQEPLNVLKPKEIKAKLDEYVIGQEDAKKVLSVSVYNHYKRLNQKVTKDEVEIEKSNVILVGRTGTGKTLLAKTIAKMLNVPFCIADATVLTEAGYVGEDVESILSRLLQAADFDVDAAQRGIVFIDEIDKIASPSTGAGGKGPDVSREGVQRDLLPIVEGSNVATKHGMVKTDHVLFIASGAFHVAKPSDLIPELQGRFPIRVELKSLTEEDFYLILTQPDNALIKQYSALLATEGVTLTFSEGAIREIARIAAQVNESVENIGARRLHTIMTNLLEELMFNIPENFSDDHVEIDEAMVKEKLNHVVADRDLSQYIL